MKYFSAWKNFLIMEEVEIIDTNADNICEFGFCGYKNIKQSGYKRKIDWLRQRFSEGMKFKVLRSQNDGAVGFIEYIPGEYAWRAVEADGYMVIHCIAIMSRKYKGQGYGSLLVKECLRDAKRGKMRGAAVVARQGTWMAGSELFLKKGFEVFDEAPPDFELLVKRFKKSAPAPKFAGDWDRKLSQYPSGLTIIRSDQCPYIEKSVREIGETAQGRLGLKPRIVELRNCHQAQQAPSAFATFNIVYNGELLTDHPISRTRFINIMNNILD
jgi:GNAT superfamily N-acetyltransferase